MNKTKHPISRFVGYVTLALLLYALYSCTSLFLNLHQKAVKAQDYWNTNLAQLVQSWNYSANFVFFDETTIQQEDLENLFDQLQKNIGVCIFENKLTCKAKKEDDSGNLQEYIICQTSLKCEKKQNYTLTLVLRPDNFKILNLNLRFN